jgi:hypothetical protein
MNQQPQPETDMADTASTQQQPATGSRLLCLLNRHEPAGRRADWNGEFYVSRCEHCDKPIYRISRGKWRRDRRRRAER